MSSNSADLASERQFETTKPGLVFDADSVSLTGKFTDELSAYRARRQWSDALNSYFLLEHGRDYEMKVRAADDFYVVCCIFHSACGRYAFWRLVNHQAPEVEGKLYVPNLINKKSVRFMLGSIWNPQNNTPWVLQADKRKNDSTYGSKSNFSLIRSLFRTIGSALGR